MKCIICNEEFTDDNFVEHVHHEIADKQYGIRTLTLAKSLAHIMQRINALEKLNLTDQSSPRRYEERVNTNKNTGLARDKYN